MDGFCGQVFWDLNLSWYTDRPEFTACFQNTVLIWIPTAFIWLSTPLLCLLNYNYNSQNKKPPNGIPWNSFNITKLVINVLLVLIQAVLLTRAIIAAGSQQNGAAIVYYVELAAPAIQTANLLLAALISNYERKKGIVSSGLQFNFWFLLAICQYFTFSSTISTSGTGSIFPFVLNIAFYPLVIAELLLNCWADTSPQQKFVQPTEDVQLDPCPEEVSSYLSKITFNWVNALVWKGYKRPLQHSDLWDLNITESSKILVPVFDKYWNKAKISKGGQQSEPVNVLPVLFRSFGGTFGLGCVFKAVADLLSFVHPQILSLLIQFVSGEEEQWKGFLYTFILFAVGVLSFLSQAQYFHRMMLTGMRLRTVLTSAVFKKTLHLSNSARNASTVGEIVNLMAVDAQKLADSALHLFILITAPMQICLAMYFLWQTLGPSVLAGLGLMICLIPVNSVIAIKMKKLQIKQMKMKDQRVKLMNEILAGIKVLKLNAWEEAFEEEVQKIRRNELKVLRKAAYLYSGIAFAFQCAPFLVAFVTFGTYVLIDEKNVLDAEKAFVSLSLFNILRRPLTMLPMVITSIIQASVSLRRVNRFLNEEEMDQDAVSHEQRGDSISIEEGTFCWNKETSHVPVLQDINLKIPNGSLCAVVGEVGSGKSSLLAAIIGELEKDAGKVNTNGTISFVAQQAWIQNLTLRENVLFGSTFEWLRYDKILEACALKPDLEILPAGDQTEIGEKGINLSGGQKQRVSLARAVYSNRDIYLLDDPLSAVDSHVGKHIFEHVIGPKGILRHKTRVLVTHGISHLQQMDLILVMNAGEITEVGTFNELLNKKGAFSEFLLRHLETQPVENEDLAMIENIQELVGVSKAEILTRQLSRSSSHSGKHNVNASNGSMRSLTRSISKENAITVIRENSKSDIKNEGVGDKLIEKETSKTGHTAWRVYLYYAKSVGLINSIAVLSLYAIFEGFSAGGNIWLSDWSNVKSVNGSQDIPTRNMYLAGYGGFGVAQVITILLAFIILAYSSIKAAEILQSDMLKRILHAPSWFFDVTPTGRIVNRFAKDVDGCDTTLPENIRDFLACFYKVLSTLVVICYSSPLFTIAIVPVGIVYYIVQRLYVSSSRELKRLESISRSPIYSNFSETINGVSTIRAFQVEDRFISECESAVDYNQRAYFAGILTNRWLSIRLEGIGVLVVAFASFFAAIGRDTLTPGLVGLSVSYALQMTVVLNWMVRMSTSVENSMVSVERLKEYAEVAQENLEGAKPGDSWPEMGEIKLESYATSYREELDTVLKDVTANIQPCEKVGIVGRTGSGKSSLALAIFRILEGTSGRIQIDDKDISTIKLHELRKRLTIIPQDPVLFSGTLRINLDPFYAFEDNKLWTALENAHLKTFVQGLPGGLNYNVAEGGQNLSVGQRQLLCLARAILRKSRILILDEATAQVDLDTDELIQQTIRTEFSNSTILTIAHRLNTIMDSNRVLVMDKGSVCEFDSPEILLANTGSTFYSMAKDAGIVH